GRWLLVIPSRKQGPVSVPHPISRKVLPPTVRRQPRARQKSTTKVRNTTYLFFFYSSEEFS
ncbi:MAG TPA: hypothetical protein PKM58_03840, partial [Pyrinomonadaceae bacterium]|nr:hypothetical protein [Pyrinomonadaceae bacterium]